MRVHDDKRRHVHRTPALFRRRRFRWLPKPKRSRLGRLPGPPRGLPASLVLGNMKHGSPPRSGAMPIDLPVDIGALIVWLVIGAIAGWLAGQIMTGGGLGLIGNIIVGIVGAIVAGWLFPYLGFDFFANPWVGAIINALIGSIIVLFVLGLLKRA
jgi:uncharacterized membrane protein YeaQ/YmgE (transglycosylase-associated protein family)